MKVRKRRERNRFDRFLRGIKRHRIAALFLFGAVSLIGLARVTDALEKLHRLLGFPSNDAPPDRSKEGGRLTLMRADPNLLKNLKVFHQGRFGQAFGDFWGAASLSNETERAICFAVWREASWDWRIFVLQPHETKAFAGHFDHPHIRILGDVASHDISNTVSWTNDDTDIYPLDFETFTQEPTASQTVHLKANILREIPNGTVVNLNGEEREVMIMGPERGPLQTCECYDEELESRIGVIDDDVPLIHHTD
jgi:hypothetical protein